MSDPSVEVERGGAEPEEARDGASWVTAEALSIDAAFAAVSHPSAGAVVLFVGLVREQNEGQAVVALEYEAYLPMARKELRNLQRATEARHQGVRTAVAHRVGTLAVGDLAVVCAASAAHRDEAFVAARELIEAVKQLVPIWKRERGPEGSHWVNWSAWELPGANGQNSTGK